MDLGRDSATHLGCGGGVYAEESSATGKRTNGISTIDHTILINAKHDPMNVKASIKRLIGDKNLGRMDYLLRPGLKNGFGGPFNGQKFRQRIYSDLLAQIYFNAAVETGTYLGTTTAFIADSGLPVYSVESSLRFFAYSSFRFRRDWERIHLFEGDTLGFLNTLASGERLRGARLFIYLDAHWNDHLPLREELRLSLVIGKTPS